jgi:hypothetical protein
MLSIRLLDVLVKANSNVIGARKAPLMVEPACWRGRAGSGRRRAGDRADALFPTASEDPPFFGGNQEARDPQISQIYADYEENEKLRACRELPAGLLRLAFVICENLRNLRMHSFLKRDRGPCQRSLEADAGTANLHGVTRTEIRRFTQIYEENEEALASHLDAACFVSRS